MRILNVEVYNFRNYNRQKVQLGEGLNIFCGKNGMGKTNLLESIYLLSTGKSTRATKDSQLILTGKNEAFVSCEVSSASGNYKIAMYLNKQEKKRITINNMPISKIGELMGSLPTVFFSPDELKMIKESPDFRRKFMDIDLCQLSKAYFYSLTRYNKILKQRNNLIKKSTEKELIESLPIWDEGLATEGSKIIRQRIVFIQKLSKYAKEIHQFLTGKQDDLVLSYQTTTTTQTIPELKEELLLQFSKNINKDISLGYTTIGIQREDIKIMLDGVDLRIYGSQGQQRTATLALKLAEIEIFKEVIKETPILLLDDVLSELDIDRQTRLLSKIQGLQTILTCTEFSNFPKINNAKIFTVNDGVIST